MIVVCRNAKKRFDKPLRKWLWQNQILKFDFVQHSLQWIWTNFKRNLLQNQRFCVETKLFRQTNTVINKHSETLKITGKSLVFNINAFLLRVICCNHYNIILKKTQEKRFLLLCFKKYLYSLFYNFLTLIYIEKI